MLENNEEETASLEYVVTYISQCFNINEVL